jgi:hypothetical protein
MFYVIYLTTGFTVQISEKLGERQDEALRFTRRFPNVNAHTDSTSSERKGNWGRQRDQFYTSRSTCPVYVGMKSGSDVIRFPSLRYSIRLIGDVLRREEGAEAKEEDGHGKRDSVLRIDWTAVGWYTSGTGTAWEDTSLPIVMYGTT